MYLKLQTLEPLKPPAAVVLKIVDKYKDDKEPKEDQAVERKAGRAKLRKAYEAEEPKADQARVHCNREAIFYKVLEEIDENVNDVVFEYWRRGCLEFRGNYCTPNAESTAVLNIVVSVEHMLLLYHFNIMIHKLL